MNKILTIFLLFILCINVTIPMFFVQNELELFQVPDSIGADSGWWTDTAWDYSKKITIDHTKVDTTLTNFPILVQITDDTYLHSHAQDDGDDILFTLDGNNETKLNHEIEYYNNDSNYVNASIWVNITSLSSSADTVIWMYYGNSTCGSQEDITGTWDSNFVGIYHFNETTGTDVHDSSGNDYDGTLEQSDHWTSSGIVNYAYDFDGTDDGVIISDNNDFDISTYTIEAWAEPDSLSGTWLPICWKSTDETEVKWELGVGRATDELANDFGKSGEWHGLTAAGVLTDSVMAYYTVVMDNANDNQYLYKNGSVVASDESQTGVPCNYANDDNVSIGCNGEASKFFTGIIDEVRISNVARNSSWLGATYNTTNDNSNFITLGSEQSAPSGGNNAPSVSAPSPADDATGVSVPPTNFTIDISDADGNNMNITWRTNESGTWQAFNYTNGTGASGSTNWYDANFTYRKLITINSSEVGETLSNFPVLVTRSSDTDLSSNAQPDGDDIFFVLYSDNTTKLNHEVENYTSLGNLTAWVNITSLSSSTDTLVWMYYGNSTCAFQGNNESTWNSNYQSVWHFAYDGDFNDSTGRYNNTNVTATSLDFSTDSGVGYCLQINAESDKMLISDFDDLGSACTAEMIVKITDHNQDYSRMICEGTSYNTNDWCTYIRYGTSNWRYTLNGETVADSGTYTAHNAWRYWAFIYDDANDNADIYENKTQIFDQTTALVKADNYDVMYIPGDSTSTRGINAGYIDEIRFNTVHRNTSWTNATYSTFLDNSNFLSSGSEEEYVSGYTGVGNGTYNVTNTSWVDTDDTKYYWSVNVTDGTDWTNNTYSFTTASSGWSNTAPTITDSSENPPDTQTDVAISLTNYSDHFNITVADVNEANQSINVTWRTNGSGSWQDMGYNETNGVCNTTYYCTNVSWVNANDTTYYWSVNVSDNHTTKGWVNATYSFTTLITISPQFRKITIEADYIDCSLSNLPVYIYLNADSNLNNNAQADGDDIQFWNLANTTQYNHEIEDYATGTLYAWVNVTSISSSVDTEFWMKYGYPLVANQEDVTGTWHDDIHLVAHFNETSGSSVLDSTVESNDGTTGNTPDLDVSGKISSGVHFDGNASGSTADYVDFGTDDSITHNSRDEIAVEGWVYHDGTWEDNIWYCDYTGADSWRIIHGSYDQEAIAGVRFQHRNDGDSFKYGGADHDPFNAGEWYHYFLTYYNGTSDFKGVYVNGLLEDSTTSNVSQMYNDAGHVRVGAPSDALDFGFVGAVDEFRIYDTNQSACWIKASYHTQNLSTDFLTIGSGGGGGGLWWGGGG